MHGRPAAGGLWLRGLCEQCNNFAGARYDAAYGDFVRRLWTYGRAAKHLQLVDPQAPPAVSVAPGLVARSVLIGMFAISPHLRLLFPQLAAELHEGKMGIAMPETLALRMAIYPHRTARLTGPVYSQRVLGKREHYNTFAEVYFPPLAWVLTAQERDAPFSGVESVLDRQGWAVANEWIRFGEDVTSVDLRNLCRHIPVVRHPLADPSQWMEMYSDEVTAFLEGLVPL
ncbi:hypothetical protein ACFWVF_22495 [Streptomyces sp. NPDC058659]|uniref:hypothetical protein n=1 Tax=unclassified Streptomyces TaxID=2593676 RepID=UPI00365380F8